MNEPVAKNPWDKCKTVDWTFLFSLHNRKTEIFAKTSKIPIPMSAKYPKSANCHIFVEYGKNIVKIPDEIVAKDIKKLLSKFPKNEAPSVPDRYPAERAKITTPKSDIVLLVW